MIALLAFLALADQGTSAEKTADRMAPPNQGLEHPCEPDKARAFIGKPASPANIARIRIATKAQIIRILKPDQAVTMEYRFGRANVLVGKRNRIMQVTCG